MGAVLFNQKTLTAAFQPSAALLINGVELTLGFELVVSTAPATIQWYLEFSETADAAGVWYREVAEEDAGLGVVGMPEVVRTFKDNNGATLAIGTHRLDTEFRRKRQFARVQMKTTTGDVIATVTAPFGTIAA